MATTHGRQGSSQKSMLSKALQKANTAVLLDNAANYEGAIDAYTDACELLSEVMDRTAGDDERQKLEEIRKTYVTRIRELRRLGLAEPADGKALPERPRSDESLSAGVLDPHSDTDDEFDDQEMYVIGTATTTRIVNKPSYSTSAAESRTLAPSQIPPRRQSLMPSALDDEVRLGKSPPTINQFHSLQESNQGTQDGRNDQLPAPSGQRLAVQPPTHQTPAENESSTAKAGNQLLGPPNPPALPLQTPEEGNNESTSWLDTIDESGASSNSSVHSRSSSLYLRKRGKDAVGGTEAEFDAALDAAVEAAYDEGLEPSRELNTAVVEDDVVSNVRRNVERAKRKVREAEMEAAAVSAREREKRRIQTEARHGDYSALDADYDDHEAEEEERILEEMMDDFEFDMQSKSALPRQSGSSGFSGRTWGSSIASNPATTGTSLSTLTEEDVIPVLDTQLPKALPVPHPPPQPPPVLAPPPPPLPAPSGPAPLPPLPIQTGVSSNGLSAPSVRERRLSGQNPKELLVETGAQLPSRPNTPRTVPSSMLPAHPPSPIPKVEPKPAIPDTSHSNEPKSALPMHPPKPWHTAADSSESLLLESPAISAFPKLPSENGPLPGPPSPAHTVSKIASAPETLREEASTPSVNGMRTRNGTLSTESLSHGPSTLLNGSLSTSGIRKAPPLPGGLVTSMGSTFPPVGSTPGPHHLFDSSILSPVMPGSPNPSASNPPAPLEPCPQSFLLRPFWLMRCLYQTIAHPRGGYLTTKLFVPRDVWRVRNVKIKSLEEKISNCDLLTAALLKVAQVDTNDADAVLEEMQSFEGILDQVQAVWARKLGNEVGVQSGMAFFKSSAQDEASPSSEQPSSRSTSGGGKSYLTSWRKLRSKSSGNSGQAPSGLKEPNKDSLNMNSLPMVDGLDAPGFRTSKLDVTQLQCTGPHANYMGALARLFDAAQVIDQIARQVEDPGLKHSSPTLVGLELSTRHAAEFFGFYVCRFALNDVGLMIDKFIKRGSEWVLA